MRPLSRILASVLFIGQAHAASIGWSYLDTPDARIIYNNSLAFLSPHATQTLTNALAWHRKRFDWTPSQPIIVRLRDESDYGNAYVVGAPRDRLVFSVAPDSHAFETSAAVERFYGTMNHELMHVAQGDMANSTDARWRKLLLGKVVAVPENPETLLYNYLSVPRRTTPRWLNEGTAVFMETWMSGGLGRAQGGYDEMVFRAMVRDGAEFYDPLGLVSRGVRSDFQTGVNAYLYGTRFVTWLAYAYSPEKVVAWMRRDEGSLRYYADQFEAVFGISLDNAWQSWIAFENEFQRANLAGVRKNPVTLHQPLTSGPIGSISRIFFDEKTATLYGGYRYPGTVEHIGAINTKDGSTRRIVDIKGSMHYRVTSFAFDPATGKAFYTNDNLAHRDLMAVDTATGEARMLLEDARIGEIVLNPADKSLIGVQHVRGMARLVRIPPPYDDWDVIHEFSYEHVPYDLDISADGRLLSASMGELSGDQFLRVWELEQVLTGNLKPLSEFRFGQSVPESFVFSRDGKYLYGSSYYTGVSNIFRYEVATGDVVAVSNAESGYFRPVPLANGQLLVLNYTAGGFAPVKIKPDPLEDVSAIKFLGTELTKRHPVVTTWQVPPPSATNLEKTVIARGDYDPISEISIESGYPVLQGYKNAVGVGYRLNFADQVGLTQIGLTAAYTPSGDLPSAERPHLELTGRYLNWRGSYSYNRSDFYDLFGPTKRARKGNAFKLGYDDYLIDDEPRNLLLRYDAKFLNKIDTLPDAQNVGTAFDRMFNAEVGLEYKDVRRSLGAVDDEKGLRTGTVVGMTQVLGQSIPQVTGTFDYGFQLPAGHASLWLRTAAGRISGKRDNPVANFYFGGFGNNYVDSREVKRYREAESLPGFEINEISGQSYAKTTLEFNAPPRIFESAGTPVFYATWLRPSLFATSLWTDPGQSDLRRRYTSLGAQFDLQFSVMHRSDITLSFGYAQGYREGKKAGDEVMISLKIM